MLAPSADHDWTLLAADESGMPAVLGVLASLPRDAQGVAIVEVPTAQDVQHPDAPAGVQVRWLVRQDAHAVPGRLTLAAVQDLDVPAGRPYAFVVGEAALATGARRHLVTARGLPKADVTFSGYWKHGARPQR